MFLELSTRVEAENRVEVPPHGLQNHPLSGMGLRLSRDDLRDPRLFRGADDDRLS